MRRRKTPAQKQKAADAAKRKRARKKREAELIKEGYVEVKIKGKKYRVPISEMFGDIIMITNHPTQKKKVLVWREREFDKSYGMAATEGELSKDGRILEKEIDVPPMLLSAYKEKVFRGEEKQFLVHTFAVKNALRREGIGTAAREQAISKAKREKVDRIVFPAIADHPAEFYEKRGFTKEGPRFAAFLDELDYSKHPELAHWGKKPEEGGFKIFWAKSRKHKKK